MTTVLDTILRKLGRDPAPAKTATNPVEPVAESLDELALRGADPRRLAEEKANVAGRRWRARAVADGAIEPEIGGPQGLEPTRYGDWEKAGRCVDF